jgi:hypothetical protein
MKSYAQGSPVTNWDDLIMEIPENLEENLDLNSQINSFLNVPQSIFTQIRTIVIIITFPF